MKYSATQIYARLTEAAPDYKVPASQAISQFTVDYYAQTRTPKGSRSRFTLTSNLAQIRGARSETAVWSYLQRKHPGCDIQIQNLTWS